MAKLATAGQEEKQSSPAPVKAAGRTATQAAGQVTGLVERTVNFLKDVRSEMRKVVTPSREEVRSTTTVVIVTVFAFAAFFYVVDGVLGYAVHHLLQFLGGPS